MSLERYESKQSRVLRPSKMVYSTLSDFSNFTPILQDKVEQWQATADTCSFKAKGFTVNLRIVEREEDKMIKIAGEDGSPFDFTFWLQMVETTESDTRIRLVLQIELNMMMRMMIGGKIQGALDQIADQIATTFNNAPV